MILPRDLFDDTAPAPRTRLQDHPSLLFSWWCTCFALVIILFRLAGRFVRTEHLFREDKIMALSIIPLFTRMALVHVVLLNGTNNIDATKLPSLAEIHDREIGSGVVLAARIAYAAFIWTAKYGICEFLARIVDTFWRRSYQVSLTCLRYFLVATFAAVVIATLAECQPFDHYWQVLPDPGPRCRQGYAQLITMGACDITTDLLLIALPIPMVIRSAIPMKRKLRLVFLFSLSSVLIVVTALRVPKVIAHHGQQQYRTVFASAEILGAAAVSNAIVLGSFLRDRGVKKQKRYKFGSTTDSMERTSQRRPTLTTQQWGSDEDLIREVGWRLPSGLEARQLTPRPAPVALPASPGHHSQKPSFVGEGWQFPEAEGSRDSEESVMKLPVVEAPMPSPKDLRVSSSRRRPVSFFDVGGLLDETPMPTSTIAPSPSNSTNAQDFAAPRRGSRALLQDLGGLRFPLRRPSQRDSSVAEGECYELTPRHPSNNHLNSSPPAGVMGPQLSRQETLQSLQDVGGLLRLEAEQAYRYADAERQPSDASSMPSPLSQPRSANPFFTSSSSSHMRADVPPDDAAGPTVPRRVTQPSIHDVSGLLHSDHFRP